MKKNNYRLLAGSLGAILAWVNAGSVTLAQEPESRSVILREGAKLSSAQEKEPGRALALASADFDEDGVPDLIASYASEEGGRISVRRGNVDAIYPNSPEAQARKANGQFTDAAFLAQAISFELSEAAEFVGAGDFDADGHWDIVAAHSGGTKLYWLRGDGRGRFASAESVQLDGAVTALVTGEINRADGLTDIAVGLAGNDGARALVFESPNGAMRGAPETFKLSAPASALVLGQLDEDHTPDLAIASGREVLTVHGRDRKLSLAAEQRADVKTAQMNRRVFDSEVMSIAVGDFAGDAQMELAALTADGSVRVVERGSDKLGKSKEISAVQATAAMRLRVADHLSGTSRMRLLATKVSSLPKDDLVVFGGSNGVRVVTTREADVFDAVGKVTRSGSARMRVAASVAAEGEVISVLPMRLNGDALKDLVVLNQGSDTPSVIMTQAAATYVVNVTGNTDDVNPGNGVCQDSAGNCTYSAAIQEANAHAGADIIEFNIPGAGIQTVSANFNQSFNEAVTVDGTTQPGSRVEIANGSYPFLCYGGNSVLRGVAAYYFGSFAIILASNGNVIEDNYIGIRADGSAPSNRTNLGVSFRAGPNGSLVGHNNLIGGTTAQGRNVISNCENGLYLDGASDITIRGNYIGTNVAGTAALPNFSNAIRDTNATGLTIGGTVPGAGNLISGNADTGGRGTISIENATFALVQGNFIGTTADGTQPLSNSGFGIGVFGPAGPVTIGGTTSAARNLIAANSTGIVIPQDNAGANTLVQGNFIGTNSAGTGALPNLSYGIDTRGPLNVTIGGTASGAGNLISGNGAAGIGLRGGINSVPTRAVVQGNLIGTDVNGVVAIPNTRDGIELATSSGSVIGGTSAEARNIISGNGENGVRIASGPNRVEGNYIGLNRFGTGALGNTLHGVAVDNPQSPNTVGGAASGAGNTIAFNGAAGIASINGRALFLSILSNSIFSSSGIGIDQYDNGVTTNPGNFAQYPVLNSVSSTNSDTTITGTLQTYTFGPQTPHTIQFFSSSSSDPSGHGEGQTFVGQTTLTAGSNATVPFSAVLTPPVPPGRYISAVTIGQRDINDANSTYSSEFSFCVRVAGESTPENTPLHLELITQNTGGNTGSASTTIIGEGIQQGATVLLRRTGYADIMGTINSLSSDGSAMDVSFDLTNGQLGAWDIVVTNPGGSTVTLPGVFTVETGRAPHVWSYVTGPRLVRRGVERAFFVLYGNSGNVDANAPVMTLTGTPGTKYRLLTGEPFRDASLRIFAGGIPGSGGSLRAGTTHAVKVLVVPPADGDRLDQQVEINEVAGLPFDWDLLAIEGMPAGASPADWTARVMRARGVIGESWNDVMGVVAYAQNTVKTDIPEMKDFDRLLQYIVAFYGGPPGEFGAANLIGSALTARTPPVYLEGPPPAPSTLVRLQAVGPVNRNATRNIVITHGFGKSVRSDFDDAAQAAREQYGDDTNVFLAEWTGDAGSGSDVIVEPWSVAQNVDRNAESLAAQLREGGFDKGLLMAGESAGAALITKAAEYLKESGSPEPEHLLLLNPANEAGGFDHGDPKAVSENSTSLHTQSPFDSQKKNADHAVKLKTPEGAGAQEQHTGGIKAVTAELNRGDKGLLEGTIPFEGSGNPGIFDGTFDPESGTYEPALLSGPIFTPLPPRQLPPPEPNPGGGSSSLIVFSWDPNDKAGPHGAGDPRFISGKNPIPYVILFENKLDASAAAQEVVITDQLDATKFDLNTFQLGLISFGENVVLTTPSGLSEWTTDVDLRPDNNLVVRVIAALNKTTGMITWRFISLDPVTMQPTEDPLAGFLPPNQTPPQGEGAVTFTINAKPNQPAGTQISNQARIVFDTNAPINTPIWTNTIDDSLPSSNVSPLAESQHSRRFQVSWAGTDTGAGIAAYSIYVSENGGPYTVWLANAPGTTAFYDGQPNSSYAFYSIAYDGAGNREETPAAADAFTMTPPDILVEVASRKLHGAGRSLDLKLALTGLPVVESRTSGVTRDHQVIFTFASAVSVGGVSVTSSDGLATATQSVDGNLVTVDLHDVANAQTITIILTDVSDGTSMSDFGAQMRVLLGDLTGDGAVNSADISAVKSQSGQAVTDLNCPADVTIDGYLNSADISLVKSQSGIALPE